MSTDHAAATTASSNIESYPDYDRLPYRSVPYQQTQPTHLAGIAALFGLSPPPPERARVLELGCASGGNIIPLAARFPAATFSGLDLSQRQVEDGKQRIATLGLTNIDIRQGDIATFDFKGQQFDYIVCHGVYSWIPPEAQDAVFRIAAETLADNGVLYVSYNTYPGWHLRTIVRDICLYHAGEGGTPEHRVARARWVLDKLANLSDEASPYGRLLRAEAALNAKLPDSYILGEFLVTHNAPCYFHEFVERAGKHGLQFFSETEIASSIPESMNSDAATLVRTIAGKSGVALEQYMDFFRGRPFRRSLLIKTSQSGKVKRTLGADSIRNLHLACPLMLDVAASKDGKTIFRAGPASVPAEQPIVKDMLGFMQQAYPGTCTPAEIVAHLIAAGHGTREDIEEPILRVLFQLIAGGQAHVSPVCERVGRASDEKPKAWPLARLEAAGGQAWVSSQRHAPVGVDDTMRMVLALADGNRTRRQMVDEVIAALRSGRMKVNKGNVGEPINAEHYSAIAGGLIDRILLGMERNALLA